MLEARGYRVDMAFFRLTATSEQRLGIVVTRATEVSTNAPPTPRLISNRSVKSRSTSYTTMNPLQQPHLVPQRPTSGQFDTEPLQIPYSGTIITSVSDPVFRDMRAKLEGKLRSIFYIVIQFLFPVYTASERAWPSALLSICACVLDLAYTLVTLTMIFESEGSFFYVVALLPPCAYLAAPPLGIFCVLLREPFLGRLYTSCTLVTLVNAFLATIAFSYHLDLFTGSVWILLPIFWGFFKVVCIHIMNIHIASLEVQSRDLYSDITNKQNYSWLGARQ
eukprot:TRINITY_DN3998_c0_g2_i2.p1 TRINITY_DN3998_c0_g2~~TRINITY_DN3998_c0_g2_i2.p1  ORF type:complete len:278 (-),score=45.99 TRINITY_DN3998_c0_g2_i2:180-1013(-)